MFTGIVEETGQIKSADGEKLIVSASAVLQDTRPGDSIAVNGVCLTAAEIGLNDFTTDIMPETLKRTTLGSLKSDNKVNLERALSMGGRIGGHLVQGHIDGIGKIISIRPEGSAFLMKISAPQEIGHYLVEKGFIAVDGISLTVVARSNSSFTVSLVAFTLNNTILGEKRSGDLVNLEVDIIAKYVERLANPNQPGISSEFLIEHGFV